MRDKYTSDDFTNIKNINFDNLPHISRYLRESDIALICGDKDFSADLKLCTLLKANDNGGKRTA